MAMRKWITEDWFWSQPTKLPAGGAWFERKFGKKALTRDVVAALYKECPVTWLDWLAQHLFAHHSTCHYCDIDALDVRHTEKARLWKNAIYRELRKRGW